jgi:hypothetical protein
MFRIKHRTMPSQVCQAQRNKTKYSYLDNIRIIHQGKGSKKMRQLASVQKITNLSPIEGADKIEVAQILGWEVVVKKDEFKVGELVVYIEIDSIVPEKPEFEFLRERKFRVRTIKLRKQVSQGIAFPLSILPQNKAHKEGDDVTETLGIIKYDPELAEEVEMSNKSKSKSKVLKFFMQFSFFRFVYFSINKKDKGWPAWIQKTDETRIQVCAKILKNNPNARFYVTEKLDGQSATYYTTKPSGGIFKKFKKLTFGVCSRNIRLGKKDNSNYWTVATKYDIKKKLLDINEDKLVVQGEIVGTKVQQNKYKLNELQFYVFNVIRNGVRCNYPELVDFCNQYNFKLVPVVSDNWTLNCKNTETHDIVKTIIDMTDRKSELNKETPIEGLVFRLYDNPSVSFKAINPKFLLKYGE